MNRLAPSTARAGGRQPFPKPHFRALHQFASVTEAQESTSSNPHMSLRSPRTQPAPVGPLRTTFRPRRIAQDRLARIEATRGVVSPFLIDSFGREHDYLRIRSVLPYVCEVYADACSSSSLTEKCNLRCKPWIVRTVPDRGLTVDGSPRYLLHARGRSAAFT